MSQDLREAVRGFLRSPGTAMAVVLLLALGIGANTAMFSIVDAAIFKPLPYVHPEQLVEILDVRNAGTPDEMKFLGVGWSRLERWRAERSIFVGGAALGDFRRVVLTGVPITTGPTLVGRISPDLIPLLGVNPALGRAFSGAEARAAEPVLLLADAFWRRAFDADRDVIGRRLMVDGRAYTVIGVMPPTFGYAVGFGSTIGWEPFDEAAARAKATSFSVRALFRLRRGLTLEEGERQLLALQAASPGSLTARAEIAPMDQRQVTMGNARVALPVLLAVVGCVLLIACANVSNLVLARAMTRRRELAVRAAMGATRGRLVRQMMAESLVLTTSGVALALFVAVWSTRGVQALVPTSMHLFEANPMAIDGRALLCCVTAALVTLLVSGLLPALRASRSDMLGSLTAGRGVVGTTPAGRRLRQSLQAGEVALTLVLLVATSLLATSFARMMWSDPGFDIDGLVTTGGFSWPSGQYPKADAQFAYMEALREQVRTLPGVRAAAIGPPPAGGFGGPFIPVGRASGENIETGPRMSVYVVSPDYFAAVGITILQGRGFMAGDRPGSPSVALIDEAAAAHYWPGTAPIGQQFRFTAASAPHTMPATVIGVVRHVKTLAYASATGSIQVYLPAAQQPASATSLVLRLSGDPGATLGAIARLATNLDPRSAMNQPAVVADMYGDTYVAPRFYVAVVSIFAGLALATSAVGLFSLLSYAVSERTREIGVRLALGADRRRIQALVLAEAMGPVAAGVGAGLVAALWLTRALQAVLFGLTPHDATAYAAAVAALMAVASVAAILPARRATRVDPVIALRE
jgi:putative ABC transport system permease protein